MAGRGTDIVLGGTPEGREAAEWQEEHDKVLEAGGLHIIGTERHESRRIDNQLRGRSGRQGDPGHSRFYVSFEDDLMRRFAPDWLPGMLSKLGMDEDVPIESGMVTKALENAQTKVEGHNFDIRKHLVEYDDVMNVHRDVVYTERTKVLEGANLHDDVFGMVEEEIKELIATQLPNRQEEAWDRELLIEELQAILPLSEDASAEIMSSGSAQEIEALVLDEAEAAYETRENEMGEENMRLLERLLLLQSIDRLWVEHLTAMDEMRQGIGLQAYGQQDPLVAYKREARDMWDQLLANIRRTISHAIYHVNLSTNTQPQSQAPAPNQVRENRPDQAAVPAARVNGRKLGRNDPCYCGSGKKYKRCHGLAA
jgi:preprotein translocase subunit SecA